MAYLEVEGVSKSYGPIKALRDVSFSVNRGEYLCILGPTGAGKTTLLKVIAGLIKPDKGRILIDGEDVTFLPPELRAAAYMPQGYALFPHMRVWENIAYGTLIRGLPLERVWASIKMVGLAHKAYSYPHELSGGQQQRVALARVVSSGSKILLLDEPLSALDLLLNIELRYELHRYAKSMGLTVLHVTHNSEEALSIADRVLILRKGKVQQIGRPDEVYAKPRNLFVARFLGEITVVEGVVRASIDNRSVVEAKGLGRLVVNGSVNKGSHVVIAYRPEDLVLLSSPSEPYNVFRGKVIDVEFEGLRVRIHVMLSKGLESVIDQWFVHEIPFKKDETVYVYLPPEKALIFEYPRESISQALALE